MFLVDKLKGTEITPLRKFQNTVRLIGFLRGSYQNSKDITTQAKLSLLKPQRYRNVDDYSNIEALMSRFDYFIELKQKYGVQLFQNFCQFLYFKREDVGRTIIQADQIGYTFFVIIGGNVGIYITKPEDNEEEQLMEQSPSRRIQTLLKANTDIVSMMEINQLHVGQCFGEAALLQSNARTSATVITNEICEFACIERKQFWNILGKFQQTEFSSKLRFLRSLCFLKDWYEQDLKTLSYHFNSIKLIKDQVIYRKNDACDGVYFVKSGSISIIGTVKYRSRLMLDDCDQIMRDKFGEYRDIILYNLTQGAIFGDEEITHVKSRSYKAVCCSMQGEIYIITKSEIDHRLWWHETREDILQLAKNNQELLKLRQSQLGNHEKIRHKEKPEDLLIIDHVIRNKQIYHQHMIEEESYQRSNFKTNVEQRKCLTDSQVTNIDQMVRRNKLESIPNIDLFNPTKSLNNSFTKTIIGQTKSEKKSQIMSLHQNRKQQWADLDVFQRAKLLGLDLVKTSIKDKRRNLKIKNQNFQNNVNKMCQNLRFTQNTETCPSEDQKIKSPIKTPNYNKIFKRNSEYSASSQNLLSPCGSAQRLTTAFENDFIVQRHRNISEHPSDFSIQRNRVFSEMPNLKSSMSPNMSQIKYQPLHSRDTTKASIAEGQKLWHSSSNRNHKLTFEESEFIIQDLIPLQTTKQRKTLIYKKELPTQCATPSSYSKVQFRSNY